VDLQHSTQDRWRRELSLFHQKIGYSILEMKPHNLLQRQVFHQRWWRRQGADGGLRSRWEAYRSPKLSLVVCRSPSLE